MPERDSICGQLAAIFNEKLHIEAPPYEADLIDNGILDSLQFVELLSHIERQFGLRVSVDELDLDNFRCIARIAAVLQKKLILSECHPTGAPDLAPISG